MSKWITVNTTCFMIEPLFPYSWPNKYFDAFCLLFNQTLARDECKSTDQFRTKPKRVQKNIHIFCSSFRSDAVSTTKIISISFWNKMFLYNTKNYAFQCLFPYVWFLFMRCGAITIHADQTVLREEKNRWCYSHCAEITPER